MSRRTCQEVLPQNSQLFDRPEEIIVSFDRFAVESSRRIINIAVDPPISVEQGVSPEICLCRSTCDAFVDDLSGGHIGRIPMLPGAIGGFVGMNPSCPKHAVDPGLGQESVHRVIVMEVDGVIGEIPFP